MNKLYKLDYETSFRILYNYFTSLNQPIDYQCLYEVPMDIEIARLAFLQHQEEKFGNLERVCPGCYPFFQPGQLAHMQYNGCLNDGQDDF